jgi:hypothetical protein
VPTGATGRWTRCCAKPRVVSVVRKAIILFAVIGVAVALVVATSDARPTGGGGMSKRAGPVPHRLLAVLNSSGPAAFKLVDATSPKGAKTAAIRDALRDASWHPLRATGVSLVRFAHRAANIPRHELAWLVSLKPRKPVYDGTKSSPGFAANYFVVIIGARDGRFLGSADGYSPALAHRSGRHGWETAQLA